MICLSIWPEATEPDPKALLFGARVRVRPGLKGTNALTMRFFLKARRAKASAIRSNGLIE